MVREKKSCNKNVRKEVATKIRGAKKATREREVKQDKQVSLSIFLSVSCDSSITVLVIPSARPATRTEIDRLSQFHLRSMKRTLKDKCKANDE